MTDIPIIFSGPMVRALLDGRKTMTRRLAWRQTVSTSKNPRPGAEHRGDGYSYYASPWQRVKPGDRLYVREQHWRWGRWVKDGKTKTGAQRWRFQKSTPYSDARPKVVFVQPEKPKKRTDMGYHKRPSIFLEREFSRIALTVTATKVEPLQAISEANAKAEGTELSEKNERGWVHHGSHRDSFCALWMYLHGAASWDANPEVVAITFTVAKQNIDA